ncbi:hypothetical protein Aph01nite_56830 [Acrocarpospora phusangensis]|uniref:Uncharacterized protein n=1 Tax=Acrocarpospora phusangensis TaxID=1070424 RepID=A0A919QGZ5_9ACTN|nr:hypothetical protein [Acrocarpospora phusangensis]GIH27373.1 hypothetical protein Aph01nite_56830 [Acrocarpospora phusangensis]
MSEVVPLPSFGEVFFDARGQDRVLRVTWHEGTLVLSLWRGEMCTASFRMPMDDVGRLLETLDVGFAEAGGTLEAPQAVVDGTGPFPQPEFEDYPGTGQYTRPPAPVGYEQGYPDTPAYAPPPQPAPAPAAAALGPNDVLVARGTPNRDRLVAVDSGPQRVPVPREREAPREQPPYEPAGPAEPVYQFPSPIPGRPAYRFDPEPQPEPQYAEPHYQGHQPDPRYAQPQPQYQQDYHYQPEPQQYPDPRDPRYQQQQPQQPQVDPADPLGLGPVARPYVPQEQMYATGERLRPPDRDDQRDW